MEAWDVGSESDSLPDPCLGYSQAMCPSTKLQCSSSVRSIYVIGLLRGTMTQLKVPGREKPLWSLCDSTGSASPKETIFNLPIKPWAGKASLPRRPGDLSLCEEWPFVGAHRLSKRHPHRPPGLVWACLLTCANTSTLGGHPFWLPHSGGTRLPSSFLHPSCDWCKRVKFLPHTVAWEEMHSQLREHWCFHFLEKLFVLVNPLNAEAYIC